MYNDNGNNHLKIYLLSKTVMFRCHVSFLKGCHAMCVFPLLFTTPLRFL